MLRNFLSVAKMASLVYERENCGGALFARKNYAVPHCLIVEISYLLPQNVRKNMRLQSLKGIKLYVIETQFLELHILYVGLLDLVTIE